MAVLASTHELKPMIKWATFCAVVLRCGGLIYLVEVMALLGRLLDSSSLLWDVMSSAMNVVGTNSAMVENVLHHMAMPVLK